MKEIRLSAIDPYVIDTIIEPVERDSKNGYITWGEDNSYPSYLNSLYNSVSTLRSVIEGTSQFIAGNSVIINNETDPIINSRGETVYDLVLCLSRDYLKYGGFAINVIRDRIGRITDLYYVPLERLRTNEDRSEFYYSTDWSKYRVKTVKYNRFGNEEDLSSVYYYSSDRTNTYPSPLWSSAVIACEIEKNVNQYWLNNIINGFSANYIIGLNNGIPNDEQKEEIERYFYEKFCGKENSGRLLIAYSDDKDHSPDLNKLETEDVGEKYKSLIDRTRSEIFCSFRATPNLFGIPTETTGFNEQEYNSSFKLYNRTTVRPIQKVIVNSLSTILNKEIKIEPFTLEGAVENNIES